MSLPAIIIGGLYKHGVKGTYYRTMALARTCDTLDLVVVYSSLKPSYLNGTNQLLPGGTYWTRRLADFQRKFKLEEEVN